MLMRSESETPSICEETDVKVICAVEEAAEEYKDCPAACRKDNSKEDEKEDNTVVKSGDLAVTAKAAEGKKALIGGTSDLDTITFKTSEDVTISSITLERYGYSTIDDVRSVQLEDEDGNIIADAKEPNSKGQVKLTLKKDYKTVDGTFKATVVVNVRPLPVTDANKISDEELEIYWGENADKYKNGSTLGFKVIAAESTAKNLNLDDYTPYTYDLVNYAGSAVQFSSRNSDTKSYNFEAGEMYELAKFRVKAPSDAAILVKGFTMNDDVINTTDAETKKATTIAQKIDAAKYVKDVEVTVDGKEVSGLKWKINKDDELVISFSDVEISAKQTSTFAVKASFNEDFNEFGYSIQYNIADMTKFNALDKKTESRVTAQDTYLPSDITWTTYTINGSKIKLSGTKLGTVNAAAGATNVKVAEGNITVSEAIRWTATIQVKEDSVPAIDEIRLVVNGEEFDGSKWTTTNHITTYNFKGVEIEKSGKVEVRVDLKSADDIKKVDPDLVSVEFAESINSTSFIWFKYDESGKTIDDDNEVSGSISISSIRIQAARASLENKKTKDVELINKETNRKTIFEGTYSAKKGAVTLKDFVITVDKDPISIVDVLSTTPKTPTFYITVGNDEYDAKWTAWGCGEGENKYGCAKWDIDDIEVADGKSVNVKVEIEFTPKLEETCEVIDDEKVCEVKAATYDAAHNIFTIALSWEDEDNNPAGEADEETAKVKVVEQGTLETADTSNKSTVLLKSTRDVAKFTIKPSKSGEDDMVLKTMEFKWWNLETNAAAADADKLKIDIDGDTYTVDSKSAAYQIDCNEGVCTIKPEVKVPAEGLVVKVTVKSEIADGMRSFILEKANDNKSVKTTFNKYWVSALLENMTQKKEGDETKYTLEVNNDTSNPVSDLRFYIDKDTDHKCTEVDVENDLVADTSLELDDSYCTVAAKKASLSSKDNSFSAVNEEKAHSITAISYFVGETPVVIFKSQFEDFFKAGSSDLMVYSNK